MKKILYIIASISSSFATAQLYTPNKAINATTNINATNNIGVGTAVPTEKLSITGNISLQSNLTNLSARPDISSGTISGEFRGIGAHGTEYDDGFLRLSAGGGTNSYNKTYIDLSGYAETIPERHVNIVMGTSGKERLRIDRNGFVGIGENTPTDKLSITAGHMDTSILLHAANGGNPHAYLSLWASEPSTTYNGVGIANNVRNYFGNTAFAKINPNVGGSYMRLLENQINFNVLTKDLNKNIMTLNPYGVNIYGQVVSSIGGNEGGSISLINESKTGSEVSNWVIYNMAGVYGNSLQFWAYTANGGNSGPRLKISDDGNMALYGKLEAKEVKVTTTPTADFVFEEDYQLPTLESVEKHIKAKKHLPEIASAKVMEQEGVNIGEFQIKLLQKIEELTLYSIEQNKQIKSQSEKIQTLETENRQIRSLLDRIEKLEQSSFQK